MVLLPLSVQGSTQRRAHRAAGFLADVCTDSAGFLSDFYAAVCFFAMSSGIKLSSLGTPYTSAGEFSADASHLSGGGGMVASQHVVVTIRLPSWLVPHSPV